MDRNEFLSCGIRATCIFMNERYNDIDMDVRPENITVVDVHDGIDIVRKGSKCFTKAIFEVVYNSGVWYSEVTKASDSEYYVVSLMRPNEGMIYFEDEHGEMKPLCKPN